MWVLESDGELLAGRKLWLKPGTQFLIGRTKTPDTHGLVIENKSVSRKHLVITVEDARAGSGANVHQRSVLKIRDFSKVGTTLDGESKFVGEERILDKDEHSIRLGTSVGLLRIKWIPVVLTLASPSRKLADPTAPLRSKLERFDIKVTLDYEVSQTSHVISSKRNTAKGLQALINGKWIVSESFANALDAAAQPTAADGSSPLEEDFIGNWPSEADFLPPVGREPVERPAKMFKPNPARDGMFATYGFVFFDQAQYDTLQPPITNGHGKAYFYNLKMGKTTVSEFMAYVKDLSGTTGSFDKCVSAPVVVQFNAPAEHMEWATEFIKEIALQMDQRAINQSEFLDAVVTADASALRRALREADDDEPSSSIARPTRDTSGSAGFEDDNIAPASSDRTQRASGIRHGARAPSGDASVSESAVQEVVPATHPTSSAGFRRKIGRGASVQPRFKGFDDLDVSQLPNRRGNVSLPTIDDDDIDMQDDITEREGLSQNRDAQNSDRATNSRKRPADTTLSPLSDRENESEMIDGMLSGARALKKRRLEEGQPVSTRPTEEAPLSKGQQILAQKPRPKMEVENINVKELVNNRREEEERRRQEDEEALRNAMEGVDISTIRGMATIEEFDPGPRTRQARSAVGPSDNAPGLESGIVTERESWKDAWNGRKNFKKFRRKGEAPCIRSAQRVIVPLKEVKRKDFGIDDEYWLEASNAATRSKSQSQGQTQSVHEVRETPLASQASSRRSRPGDLATRDDDADDGSFRRRTRRGAQNDHERLGDSNDVQVPGTLAEDLSAPAREKHTAKERSRQAATADSEAASSTARSKRPAAGAAAPARPSKRQEKVVEESEGEDDGRFRFRRRR